MISERQITLVMAMTETEYEYICDICANVFLTSSFDLINGNCIARSTQLVDSVTGVLVLSVPRTSVFAQGASSMSRNGHSRANWPWPALMLHFRAFQTASSCSLKCRIKLSASSTAGPKDTRLPPFKQHKPLKPRS